MSTTVTRRAEIPAAPWYVLSNDRFMSGWGEAEGRTNTVILPCESLLEAERVATYVRSRPEQERVRIVRTVPRLRPHVLYSLMSREDASRWYE